MKNVKIGVGRLSRDTNFLIKMAHVEKIEISSLSAIFTDKLIIGRVLKTGNKNKSFSRRSKLRERKSILEDCCLEYLSLFKFIEFTNHLFLS